MIVRVSEAQLIPGAEEEFLGLLLALVASFPARYRGLVRHEVLVDHANPRRVQYVSTWVDEEALIEYAGRNWRSEAVTFPNEEKFLTTPLSLRHYTTAAIKA
ncbi:antibiotic biosynthesis monooxygenase [Microbacterium sp. SORGH_AS_0888]|uniref:antibiotic biosynthesis monooxygenase n=1 Tax=Microbacterium sp. SORGH_AS_0888 TaxID=3041791 RepID=UPI00277D23C2|nr:antibiotic biosynthesis monooxygenase [Microbacterium sp. SORGH_AS_0888]MDQ1131131.1 quinol monooxygenase YgiN [Microbacterium sp. SORGH_AS_0888]